MKQFQVSWELSLHVLLLPSVKQKTTEYYRIILLRSLMALIDVIIKLEMLR